MAASIGLCLRRVFPLATKCNILKPYYLLPNRMMASDSQYSVQHNGRKNEFYISLGKDKAVLQYEVIDPFTLELWHTEVPESLRGKGIGQLLAKAAMEHVVKEDLKMDVSCPYLQKYLKDNPKPEYVKRLARPLGGDF